MLLAGPEGAAYLVVLLVPISQVPAKFISAKIAGREVPIILGITAWRTSEVRPKITRTPSCQAEYTKISL